MKVKFVPTGQEIESDPNKSLLQLCVENQIEIKSICKGVPSCAECRIRVVEGEHNIVPPSKAEMSLIGTNYFIDQRRLACQVHCYGDITVDLTEQIERSEIQSKKVRGFRSPGQRGSNVETQAKQGTLVLEEGPVHTKGSSPGPSQHPGINVQHGHPEEGTVHPQQTEGRDHRNSQKQGQKQGQGRNRNRRGGGQNRNRGPDNRGGNKPS